VVCPVGQVCVDGECGDAGTGGSGTGGGGTGGGGGATSSSGSSSGNASSSGVFGLPTGGSGCGCKVGQPSRPGAGWLALLGLGMVVGLRRSRRDRREA
jgi:MYXO-CTERM domain-containing protein